MVNSWIPAVKPAQGKPTLQGERRMSSLPLRAGIYRGDDHVSFGPLPYTCIAVNRVLFDHLVEAGAHYAHSATPPYEDPQSARGASPIV